MKLSYSSMSSYETCPLQYRYAYVDGIPAQPSPFLSFGSSIHSALEYFYSRRVPVAPALEELLETYEAVWISQGYADPTEEATYREHGREVLRRYYADNAADYHLPAATEQRFSIDVEGVTFTGVIDRLDRMPGGGYEILDYKTNRKLATQAQVDSNLQLTVYYMASREVWGIEPEKLTLYFLLPGRAMSTRRVSADADGVRRQIVNVAERIQAGKFEPRQNPLCDWCDYQSLCPIFRHKRESEQGAADPDIVAAVDEWVALKRKGREVYRRIDELQAIINAYCEENDYRKLYGSDGAAVDRRPQRITAPDEEKIRRILEPLGLWDSVLAVDRDKLTRLVEARRLPPDVEDAILSSREDVRTQYALYLSEPRRRR
jgi:putative RecB family exonuclease